MGLHVSISQLKCYVRCPRQYQLKYVLGVPAAFVPVALAFGSAIHAALAGHYQALHAGQRLALPELISIFRDAWTKFASGPVPLQADDDADGDLVDRGVAMLRAFTASAAKTPVHVASVERTFSVELNDPDSGERLEERLVGAFDLVVKEGERFIIVEHKTAAKRWSADQLRYDFQPTAYKLAGRKLDFGDVGLRFQILTKTKLPAVHVEDIERDAYAEDDLLRTVIGVLRAIDAGGFWPNRGWQCKSCQYAHACAGAGS